MIFYCPNCWQELHSDSKACPRCGKDPSSWEKRSYASKLIQALSHPEPETQRRAVFLLGEKRIADAVSALTALFRQTTNPFLACEIIEALGKVGSKAAFATVSEALHHPAFFVRGEAVNALARFSGEDTIPLLRDRSVNDASAYVRETAGAILCSLEKAEEKPDEPMPK